MQASILQQGIELMLYGMGAVFVFLTVLVLATSVMSRVVIRFFPDPLPTALRLPKPRPVKDSGVTDPKLLAIIRAAIAQHRAKLKSSKDLNHE